ncbi:MAG: 4-(cytidine 5'-diphospho)-2-C-methyl-D-erythritol kinase, partial [Acutalibacteraceae bacterium]
MEVTVKAPAKINLSLDVLGKRFDGYHDVYLSLQTVSLFDTVKIETTAKKEIEIFCDNSDVPCDSSNIVYKAAERFFEYTKEENSGIKITIEKNIPTEAGLAGGSSDGAATVLGLNALYKTHLKSKEMEEICEKIGADVPFFIEGGTQIGKGIEIG